MMVFANVMKVISLRYIYFFIKFNFTKDCSIGECPNNCSNTETETFGIKIE